MKKTHKLFLPKTFPPHHKNNGAETFFEQSILENTKKHCIVLDYNLWIPKLSEVIKEDAVLSINKVDGLNHKEIKQLKSVNFQVCKIDPSRKEVLVGKFFDFVAENVEQNEGLSKEDFWSYYKRPTKALIIHFSKNYY